MWIDSEVFVADDDYQQFTKRGYSDPEIKELASSLYRNHQTPVSYDPNFDWDNYFTVVAPPSSASEETPEVEEEEQSSDPDDNKNSDKKVGDPASDSGSKHSAPEGNTSETKQDLSAAKSDK